MKALITGADGFIGSHLTELLLEKGYQVRALSCYNSFNNWGWLEEVEKSDQLEVIAGDIRDPFFCRKLVEGVDIIYHLAALIAIPYSYIAPSSYVDTNVKGTLNICQAALDTGGIRVIQTSTSEVYGTAQYVPIDEKHPRQPQSPYSASKIGADMMAMSYYYSFELPVSVARPFNTFGPRQSARAIIPSVITQIAAGKKRIELGDLRPTRDFNFVKDTVQGLLAIAGSDDTIGMEINISTGTEISMNDTVELIKSLMQADVEIIKAEERIRPGNSEVQRLCGDNSRLLQFTSWSPRYSLEDGLKETIDWFTQPGVLSGYKTDIYNV